MPHSRALSGLAVTPMKCCRISSASSAWCASSHSRAVRALASVSMVVKDLEETMKIVVSGSSTRNRRLSWLPSMLDAKCTRRPAAPGVVKSCSASQAMAGPRSEPPTPILTMSVTARPL